MQAPEQREVARDVISRDAVEGAAGEPIDGPPEGEICDGEGAAGHEPSAAVLLQEAFDAREQHGQAAVRLAVALADVDLLGWVADAHRASDQIRGVGQPREGLVDLGRLPHVARVHARQLAAESGHGVRLRDGPSVHLERWEGAEGEHPRAVELLVPDAAIVKRNVVHEEAEADALGAPEVVVQVPEPQLRVLAASGPGSSTWPLHSWPLGVPPREGGAKKGAW
mmetsp:Transcript_123475/g.310937  ORF Transcript_123475/g.310937 Transcript_123475/m.310937 type:complete len:224 (+) Transcript_123475:184-855(+)